MRLFTALLIPDELREHLVRAMEPLRKKYPGLKWARKDALHITLNFFGEVEERLLPLLESAMESAALRIEAFEMLLRGIGFFPRRSSARVVYLGVEQGGKECRELRELIAQGTAGNISLDRRSFTPHLTLARVKTRTDLPDPAIESRGLATDFTVDRIDLYRSHLKKTGAEYELIRSVPLGSRKG